MKSVYYSDYKKILVFVFPLLAAIGCASSNQTQDVQEPVIRPDMQTQETAGEEFIGQPHIMELNYRNESTSIRLPIDLNSQNVYLELRGKAVEEKKDDKTEVEDIESGSQAERIRSVMNEFVSAQNAFYRGNYEQAMEAVNRSLNIEQTADALALKGTIYFMLGNNTEAQRFWTRAMRLNPDLPVPDISELEDLIDGIDL